MVDEPLKGLGIHLRQRDAALVEPGQEVVASVAAARQRPDRIAFGTQLGEVLIEVAQAVGEISRTSGVTPVLGESNEPARAIHVQRRTNLRRSVVFATL